MRVVISHELSRLKMMLVSRGYEVSEINNDSSCDIYVCKDIHKGLTNLNSTDNKNNVFVICTLNKSEEEILNEIEHRLYTPLFY